ncbi:MAG: R3H domain-containing nucleic acid-binding protein [Ornithinimicrobium sp.]
MDTTTDETSVEDLETATGTPGSSNADSVDTASPSDTTSSSDSEISAQTPRRSRAAADLEREGEVAADFLETLMDITDLDGDLEVDVDGDRAAVSIVDSEEGSVPRRLVGPQGAVLEALQELTRLAVQAETGERSRLMLDIGGHRAQRRDTLVHTAADVIAAVNGDGQQREMEPMTAFERKVVHDEVLRAGLRSQSEGEEPRRFVVVLPALSS